MSHDLSCLLKGWRVSPSEVAARIITGSDILALGVPQGPAVGRWHREAYTAQLDGTFPERHALLDWLEGRIVAEQDGCGERR